MEALEEALQKNPGFKILGKDKLKKKLGALAIRISTKVIDEWFKSKEINQIYAKPKKVKSYRINGPPNSFQMDIILLPTYQKSNNGVKEFLMLIDILSRKVWAYPLKNGKMDTVMQEYRSFVNSVGKDKIMSVEGDDFFSAASLKDYNNHCDIKTFTDIAKDDHLTNHGNILGIIDRAVRTLKNYIEKYLLIHDTTKWVDALPAIIEIYNDSPHSSLHHRTPNEAYDDEVYLLKKYLKNQQYNDDIQRKLDFAVGDIVRAMVGKNLFDKEKAPFSKELYTIEQEDGRRYIIMDEKGKTLKRRYRPSELLKITGLTERLGKEKQEVEKEHKKINKTRKGTGKSYSETIEDISNRDEPRQKRRSTSVTRMNL